MRLIDADECFRLAGGKHNVCEDCLEHKIREDCLGCPMLHIKEALAEAPTIDAEPVVHAKWEKRMGCNNEGEYVIQLNRCSNCNYVVQGKTGTKYCPYCGAKMDEVIE